MAGTDVSAIHGVVSRAKRRVRLQAALDGAVTATILGAAVACAAIFAMRVDLLPTLAGASALVGAVAIVVAGAILGALREVDDEAIARRIDRASGLADRLSTAIAFDRHHAELDTGFVALAIADGVRAAPRARVEEATPYRKPRDLRAALLFVAVSALVAGLAIPTLDRHALAPAASVIDTRAIESDRPAWDVAYAQSLIDDLRTLAITTNDRRLRTLADQLEAHLGRLVRNEIDKLALLDAFETAAHDALDGDSAAPAGGQIDDLREAIRRLQPRGPGARPDAIAIAPPPPPPSPPKPPPPPPGPGPTGPPSPTTNPNPTPAPGTPPPGTPDPDKPGWDNSRDRNLKGDATKPPPTPSADVVLPGSPNATPSRRTVIKAAATHGFALAPYKKVYSEYRTQDEAVMNNDKLPSSYRYYIKRYFQRIKPD